MIDETRAAIREITAMRCRLMAQEQTNLAAVLTGAPETALRRHFLESAFLLLEAAKALDPVKSTGEQHG